MKFSIVSAIRPFDTLVFFILFLLIPVFSALAEPDLVTDRPDQTESSAVIAPGYIQIESGITRAEADDYAVTESLGTLVRIGLVDRLELRLGIEGWIDDEAVDSQGFGDSNIGVKYYLWDENGWIPESALLAGVCIPTAKNTFEGKRFDPGQECSCRATSVRWAGSYTLTDRLSAGINIAAAWECYKGGEGDRHFDAKMPYSAVLGISVTDRIGCFVEFFDESAVNPGGKPANLFDGGFTWLVTDTFQLDIAGGTGVSDEADDWFAGAGLSYRFKQ